MTKEKDEFTDLPSLKRPRDIAWSNWAKFENVGDSIAGYIADVFYRPEQKLDDKGNVIKAQRGITLKQKDGTLVNTSVKYIPFILAGTDNLRLGDPVKFVFEKELPAQQKMYKPTKVIEAYGRNLPENAGNKTVKELTEEDAKAGGTVVEASVEEPSTEDTSFDDFK